jgi:hypothetical protein
MPGGAGVRERTHEGGTLVRRVWFLFCLLACLSPLGGAALDLGMGLGVRTDITLGKVGSSAWFDARYLRVSTGLTLKLDASSFKSWLNFGGLVKYPFTLGPLEIFPMLGAEYELNLSDTDSAGTDLRPGLTAGELAGLSTLCLEAGAGIGIRIHLDARTNTPWRVSLEALFGYNPSLSFDFQNGLSFKVNLMYGFTFPKKIKTPDGGGASTK